MNQQDGTSQTQRLLSPLRAGFFRFGELSFAQQLAYLADLAATLPFVATNGHKTGTWRQFLFSDELFVFASMAAYRLPLADVATDGDEDAQRASACMRGFSQISEWWRYLERNGSDAAANGQVLLRQLANDSIQRIFGDFRQITGSFFGASGFDAAISELHPALFERNAVEIADTDVSPTIERLWLQLQVVMVFISGKAEKLLEQSFHRNDHDPSISLLITYVQLLAKVSERSDELPERYKEFYVDSVLGLSLLPGHSDRAYVNCIPGNLNDPVILPAGTILTGGDAREPTTGQWRYRTERVLELSDLQISSLIGLSFERDRAFSPENALGAEGAERGMVTSATLYHYPDVVFAAKPLLADRRDTHPFLGPMMKTSNTSSESARFGFAIASETLRLKEGQRHIRFQFRFDRQRSGLSIREISRRLVDLFGTTPEDAFHKAFRQMFAIEFTGEAGWITVDEYVPTLQHAGSAGVEDEVLVLSMHLTDGAPSVVGYDESIHGMGIETCLPVARFVFGDSTYFYPYSLLEQLVVEEVSVFVDVEGCRDLIVANQFGPLSLSGQFAPFGPSPAVGDFLAVGSREAVAKFLTRFSCRLEWVGLPAEKRGFAAYYEGYEQHFSNDGFVVGLNALSDRQWLPLSSHKPLMMPLFRQRLPDEVLVDYTDVDFSAICASLHPVTLSETEFRFDAMAKDGFFRISLRGPSAAFGHGSYAQALSSAVNQQALAQRGIVKRLLRRSTDTVPMPKAPWLPTLGGIYCSYSAQSSVIAGNMAKGVSATGDALFHLHPLGVLPSHESPIHDLTLVPPYGDEGNLFIGLTGEVLASTLTLYFELVNDQEVTIDDSATSFFWHALVGDQWHVIEPSRIHADSTQGFRTSGIVLLELPASMDRQHRIMPEGYWLRLSSQRLIEDRRSLLRSVSTHAVPVCRVLGEDLDGSYQTADGLPAGSINGTERTHPGVVDVIQREASFSGRQPETRQQRLIRVSEYASHRGRAVTSRDYERLVLANFAEVFKVKCFPCLTGRDDHGARQIAGNTLVVVLPDVKGIAAAADQRLYLSAVVLKRIHAWLSERCSPFAKLHVRNPAYELVQVRCAVRFRDRRQSGKNVARFNEAVAAYLSPWQGGDAKPTFGRSIRLLDLQAYLHGLDFIEAAEAVSLVRIIRRDDGSYRLRDSAREQTDTVAPELPWSVMLPAKEHLLEPVDDQSSFEAQVSGVNHLSIDHSFIVS